MAFYKLFLADDSLTIQKVVELVLADENFEIKAFSDGEQALEAVVSSAPDIVLADIDMPKLNGYQLCEKIKNNTSTVHIPVILLAGAFEPFDEEHAKSVGADDSIIKPFESQELISKVKALLVGVEPASGGPSFAVDTQELSTAGIMEGPQLDDEISIDLEEKDDLNGVAEEELIMAPGAGAVGKGFDDELSEAMTEEKPPAFDAGVLAHTIELPSKEKIEEIVKQSVENRVSVIFGGDNMPVLISAIKEAAAANLEQNAPRIIEDVTRQVVTDIIQSLHGEISAAIGKIVPEVAETIIKKEIDKITARS